MCEDTDAREYKSFFETFIDVDIHWVPHEDDLNLAEKYLLLVDIQSRIPDDVEFSLSHFKRQGKI